MAFAFYGRSGKHPFQSWHGELPGTLPMMTGVGEAPCEILSYESDGLPKEYLGQLLVTSWADHRVERYQVKPHGASFKAERLPFVQGPSNFRPTGMCVAPDGSIFVADWVKSDYTLHGKGAIWHIRWKDAPKVERPDDLRKAIASLHRPFRDAATTKLAIESAGREFLWNKMTIGDERFRSSTLPALVDTRENLHLRKRDELDSKLRIFVEKDPENGVRELALQALIGKGQNISGYLNAKFPPSIRAAAIASLTPRTDAELLLDSMADTDPFIRHPAFYASARLELGTVGDFDFEAPRDPLRRIGLLLSVRHKFENAKPEAFRKKANAFGRRYERCR